MILFSYGVILSLGSSWKHRGAILLASFFNFVWFGVRVVCQKVTMNWLRYSWIFVSGSRCETCENIVGWVHRHRSYLHLLSKIDAEIESTVDLCFYFYWFFESTTLPCLARDLLSSYFKYLVSLRDAQMCDLYPLTFYFVSRLRLNFLIFDFLSLLVSCVSCHISTESQMPISPFTPFLNEASVYHRLMAILGWNRREGASLG